MSPWLVAAVVVAFNVGFLLGAWFTSGDTFEYVVDDGDDAELARLYDQDADGSLNGERWSS